jgi:hypothetical protein
MTQKNANRSLFFTILVPLLPIIFFTSGCTGSVIPIPYLHLDSFSGKVIDAETKQPIEGAAVLAVYYEEAITIAGSNTYAIDAQETLTDRDGEFKIPGTTKWPGEHTGYPRGNLIIFKPGYGVFPGHKASKAVNERKTWPTPDKYIIYELPKLKTRDERKANLFFEYYAGFPPDKTGQFVRLVNEERKNLGLPLISIPEKEKEK